MECIGSSVVREKRGVASERSRVVRMSDENHHVDWMVEENEKDVGPASHDTAGRFETSALPSVYIRYIIFFSPTVSPSLSFLSSSKSNGASHDHCSVPHGNVLPCGLSSLRS